MKNKSYCLLGIVVLINFMGPPLYSEVKHTTPYDPRLYADGPIPFENGSSGWMPSACVEVIGDLPSPIRLSPIPLAPIWYAPKQTWDLHPRHAGGGGLGPPNLENQTAPPKPNIECKHKFGFEKIEQMDQNWGNSRLGDIIFHNDFINKSNVAQAFTQEVSREIRTTCDGSINLKLACAQAGVAETVGVKNTYNITVPPGTKLSMKVFFLLHDKNIKIIIRCPQCKWVFGEKNTVLTAAAGITEEITKRRELLGSGLLCSFDGVR